MGTFGEFEIISPSNVTENLHADTESIRNPQESNKLPGEFIVPDISKEQILFKRKTESIKRGHNATDNNNFCRAPDGRYLPVDIFALDTCARCYQYIPDNPTFFRQNSKWNHTIVAMRSLLIETDMWFNVTFLTHDVLNETTAANEKDTGSILFQTFVDFKSQEKWRSCCRAAVDCCQHMLGSMQPNDRQYNSNILDYDDEGENAFRTQPIMKSAPTSNFCPPTWDGWTCWEKTIPNRVAVSVCPSYIYFETEPPACSHYAEKMCTSDGTWYRRGDAGSATEKTNYSPCSPVGALRQRTNVHLIAYTVSVAMLLPTLFIFYSYKQLNVYRIRLHKNMFMSILLNSILVIVFKVFTILPKLTNTSVKESYVDENAVLCRLALVTLKYLRLTNYMWMFCEGFYLHRLITAAFAEESSFSVFYFIGWVLPLIPTGIYAFIRFIWYDVRCWIEPIEAWEWVLNAPCLLSLVMNLVFLINIIRILVMKLRSTSINEPSQFRKAVRATLILFPLFGLHFVVTIYRPPKGGCDWIDFYHYANALLDGLQGCLVAIIFCYGNGEVHYLLLRSYRRFKDNHCLRNKTKIRTDRSQRVKVEERERTRSIGCSVFLGRSTFSTHFSLADCAPNIRQKQITINIRPVHVSEERGSVFTKENDSTVQKLQIILPETHCVDNGNEEPSHPINDNENDTKC
ncbi:calcitonin gene-related peptide type 1 receptor-like [Daphnia carinata]|uniref:calcitonin gene-related peptide type 1 receptor-like n=1 Tax=Daphnia carinata TaxID=120202 RepID=UPI002579C554|nr:calcitonin gene-related peptide type 1 receptor-like [Daphnia carinata]